MKLLLYQYLIEMTLENQKVKKHLRGPGRAMGGKEER